MWHWLISFRADDGRCFELRSEKQYESFHEAQEIVKGFLDGELSMPQIPNNSVVVGAWAIFVVSEKGRRLNGNSR